MLSLTIEFPCFIKTSPQSVIDALLLPQKLKDWLGAECRIVDEGGIVRRRFCFDSGDEALFEVQSADLRAGVVLVCEEASGEALAEWEGTSLNFRLEPLGEGCHLHFAHSDWRLRSRCFAEWVHAWDQLINTSLVNYLEQGRGEPYYPE